MGRRSDHSKEELVDLLRAAATVVIASEGLAGLTIRKVGERAGYAPGTLYNVIGNLDDLILAVNARTLDAMADALAAVPSSGMPRADVEALLERYLEVVARQPLLWAAITDHVMPDGRALPDWYAERLDRLVHIVEAALAPLLGHETPHRRRSVVQTLWASLHGIFTLARTGKLRLEPGDSVEQMARDLVGTWLDGLIARVPARG